MDLTDLNASETDSVNALLWHHNQCDGHWLILPEEDTTSLTDKGLVTTRVNDTTGKTSSRLTGDGWDMAYSLPYNRPSWVD